MLFLCYCLDLFCAFFFCCCWSLSVTVAAQVNRFIKLQLISFYFYLVNCWLHDLCACFLIHAMCVGRTVWPQQQPQFVIWFLWANIYCAILVTIFIFIFICLTSICAWLPRNQFNNDWAYETNVARIFAYNGMIQLHLPLLKKIKITISVREIQIENEQTYEINGSFFFSCCFFFFVVFFFSISFVWWKIMRPKLTSNANIDTRTHALRINRTNGCAL